MGRCSNYSTVTTRRGRSTLETSEQLVNQNGVVARVFQCKHSGCHKRYTSRFNLKRHIMLHHHNKVLYECAICGLRYGLKQYYKDHLIRSHKIRKSDGRLEEYLLMGVSKKETAAASVEESSPSSSSSAAVVEETNKTNETSEGTSKPTTELPDHCLPVFQIIEETSETLIDRCVGFQVFPPFGEGASKEIRLPTPWTTEGMNLC
mmetsp:Transcript_23429/g.26579  ORF Transcript_23429/g.26579 Transcript_23429/m.26579 type:complete len:205 (-) Transcript_23429:102-716(-)